MRFVRQLPSTLQERYGRRYLTLSVIATLGSCILLGAVDSRSPMLALGLILGVALFWLALARPAIAFIVVVACMALPFPWTPSPGGHFLLPAELGGMVFIVTGVIRKRWFRLNAIDYIVMAYVFTFLLSAIAER